MDSDGAGPYPGPREGGHATVPLTLLRRVSRRPKIAGAARPGQTRVGVEIGNSRARSGVLVLLEVL